MLWQVSVEQDGGVEELYFAKCNGFFRDSSGQHFAALQWFQQRNHDVVEPTVRLPRLKLLQDDRTDSHSIMPATCIVNGALVVGVETSYYAVMPPTELAEFVRNKTA